MLDKLGVGSRITRFAGPKALTVVGCGALALAGLITFMRWAGAPLADALTALYSGEGVIVEAGRWLVFRPNAGQVRTGLLIYPGAGVDPRAYAPVARAIAACGYRVVISLAPLRFAMLAPVAADAAAAAFPSVKRWVLAGHSLGGVAACVYVRRHPTRVAGLVLWAAFPAAWDDLSLWGRPVTVIFGTRDGSVDPARIRASRQRLPEGTQYVPIVGGNHAQFGAYRAQPKDRRATISRQAQESAVVAATVDLLRRVDSAPHSDLPGRAG